MLRNALAKSVFILWWIFLAFALKTITLDAGELPVDYRTYAIAADQVHATGSPYQSHTEAQKAWLSMHQSAMAVFRPDRAEEVSPEVVSGPYLYPPTLALIIGSDQLSAQIFLLIHTVAVIALCLGWLKFSDAESGWWLLPMAVSVDLIAIYAGGNIEIILLALALFACRLLWRSHAVLAALAIAPVLLVKPQFVMMFGAFGCLWALSTRGSDNRGRTLLIVVAVTTLLVVSEVLRWPQTARTDIVEYLKDPVAFQYMVLPLDEQWPMSIWNRAPLQVLLNFGFPFGTAQTVAIGIYVLFLTISCICLSRRQLTFPLIFAISYILFLLGRPITWSLPMLGVIVLLAAWPGLRTTEKKLLAIVTFGVAMTHWVAFLLFGAGIWPGLLTFQSSTFPWETLFVLPGAWAVLIMSAKRQARTF